MTGACVTSLGVRNENPREKSFNAEGTEETPRTRGCLAEACGVLFS